MSSAMVTLPVTCSLVSRVLAMLSSGSVSRAIMSSLDSFIEGIVMGLLGVISIVGIVAVLLVVAEQTVMDEIHQFQADDYHQCR